MIHLFFESSDCRMNVFFVEVTAALNTKKSVQMPGRFDDNKPVF